jgi:phosphoglycerate dehydrogenase-like enzyme
LSSRKWTVAWLDVWDVRAAKVVHDLTPPQLEMRFANSYDPEEQRILTRDCDVIVAGWPPVPREMVANARQLKLIHKVGVGFDNIDLEAARERGIAVAITSGANASIVAEHVVGLMLATMRNLVFVHNSLRSGRWLKSEMRGMNRQLKGKQVGILGFGNIGRQVARKLAGFDVSLTYFDNRRAGPEVERLLGVRFVPFDDLLANSDILTLHVPLDSSTRRLLDSAALAKLKHGAIIVNTSRGGVIDEVALFEALESGKVGGAALDTFDQEPPDTSGPIFGLPQVVVTPHIAGAAFDNVPSLAGHVFGNILRYRERGDLPTEDTILPGRSI